MSRQELRAPDAFQRVGVEAEGWIARNRTLVLGTVVGGLVIFFGVMASRSLSQRSEEKARTALGTAVGVLSRPVQADLPPGGTDDPPPFKSEKERDEAAVKALSGVLATYPGSKAALTATLPLAATEVRLGQLDQALDAYERMAREEGAGFEAGMGAFHRARVLALLGKKQEAAQGFAELVANHPGTPAAKMGQERLAALEAEGFKATVVPRPDAG